MPDCAPDWLQCGGDSWNGASCCEGLVCHRKDKHYSQCLPESVPAAAWEAQPEALAPKRPRLCQHSDCSTAGATNWSGALEAGAAAIASVPWSHEISVGLLDVLHPSERYVQVIRNPGGGTSQCCSMRERRCRMAQQNFVHTYTNPHTFTNTFTHAQTQLLPPHECTEAPFRSCWSLAPASSRPSGRVATARESTWRNRRRSPPATRALPHKCPTPRSFAHRNGTTTTMACGSSR